MLCSENILKKMYLENVRKGLTKICLLLFYEISLLEHIHESFVNVHPRANPLKAVNFHTLY